jgi:pyruvate kinase
LGVELPPEEVPLAQKRIVRAARALGKPVVVATQMLESMIDNPRPTRAETNAVANAVMDGADAVMLSAESASGKYPVLAVQSMSRIISSIESNIYQYNRVVAPNPASPTFNSDAIIATACQVAEHSKAKAIVSLTSSGYSAFEIAKHKPSARIFTFTRYKHLLNRLSLVWGVYTLFYERSKNTDETIQDISDLLLKHNYLQKGDSFVIVASIPIALRKSVNMIKLHTVE